jgi:hypothetical protein
MRLAAVKRGNRWPNRAFVWLIGTMSREEPEDVILALNFRSGFWGAGFSDLLQSAMRGPSEWTVGERELFAAYTSYINQCPF